MEPPTEEQTRRYLEYKESYKETLRKAKEERETHRIFQENCVPSVTF